MLDFFDKIKPDTWLQFQAMGMLFFILIAIVALGFGGLKVLTWALKTWLEQQRLGQESFAKAQEGGLQRVEAAMTNGFDSLNETVREGQKDTKEVIALLISRTATNTNGRVHKTAKKKGA